MLLNLDLLHSIFIHEELFEDGGIQLRLKWTAEILMSYVHSFPTVNIANYNKPSGLKQNQYIILQFWRETKGENLGVAELSSFYRNLEENLFLASKGHP